MAKRFPSQPIPVMVDGDGPDNDLSARVHRVEDDTRHISRSLTDFKVSVTKEMGDMNEGMGRMAGEMSGLSVLVRSLHEDQRKIAAAKLQVDTAQGMDNIDAKKSMRSWITTILGYGTGLIALATAAFAAGRC